MEDKIILTKIKSRRFSLNKIIANKIEKNPSDRKAKIKQESKYFILENIKDNISIRVNTKTFLDPEALFEIELDHIMHLKPKEEITDEEIENSIDLLLSPLGEEVSYIISSITKKMIGTHVILPPGLEIEKGE